MLWRNKKLILILLGVLVGVLLFIFLKSQVTNRYTFRTSSKTIVKELRSLNRLETASFTIEKVIDAGTSGNRFAEILFGDRILLIAHGEVIAGFDLSTLKDDNVTLSSTSIRLTLPQPQILVTDLDNDQTRVYDRRQGLLSKGDKDLETAARLEAEKVIREAACQGNILNEASKNARNQLTALLKSFGFITVVIDIPSGSC